MKYIMLLKDNSGYIGDSGTIVEAKVDAKRFDTILEAEGYAQTNHRGKYWYPSEVEYIKVND